MQYGWGKPNLDQMEFALVYLKTVTTHGRAIIER